MKKVLTSITILLAVAGTSYAQNMQKLPANRNTKNVSVNTQQLMGQAKQQATKEADAMQQQLNLTQQQKEAITDVNTKADYTTLIMAQRGAANDPNTARRMDQFKNDSYKRILTADQYNKYTLSTKSK